MDLASCKHARVPRRRTPPRRAFREGARQSVLSEVPSCASTAHIAVNCVDIISCQSVRCRAMSQRAVTRRAPAGEEERVRLDRDRILDAAEAIATSEGIGKLTMRRLGAELGADPTALYRHFRDEKELLVELADRLFGRSLELDPSLPWRERFRLHLRHWAQPLSLASGPGGSSRPTARRHACPSEADGGRARAPRTRSASRPRTRASSTKWWRTTWSATGLYYAFTEANPKLRVDQLPGLRRSLAMLPADEFPGSRRRHLISSPTWTRPSTSPRRCSPTPSSASWATARRPHPRTEERRHETGSTSGTARGGDRTCRARRGRLRQVGGDQRRRSVGGRHHSHRPGSRPPRRRRQARSTTSTWATYREVDTLDPIYAFDYPENTVMHGSLRRRSCGRSPTGRSRRASRPSRRPTTR